MLSCALRLISARVISFQFSIGDAVMSGAQTIMAPLPACFNSLLEMPEGYELIHYIRHPATMFQFSIGDATKTPKCPPKGRAGPVSILYWRCGKRSVVLSICRLPQGFNSLLEMRENGDENGVDEESKEVLFQFSIGDASSTY